MGEVIEVVSPLPPTLLSAHTTQDQAGEVSVALPRSTAGMASLGSQWLQAVERPPLGKRSAPGAAPYSSEVPRPTFRHSSSSLDSEPSSPVTDREHRDSVSTDESQGHDHSSDDSSDHDHGHDHDQDQDHMMDDSSTGSAGANVVPEHAEHQYDDAKPEMRKACDFCTRRKRKCDGKMPCYNCQEMGAGQSCVYSVKQKSGRKKKSRYELEEHQRSVASRQQQQRQQAAHQRTAAAASVGIVPPGTPPAYVAAGSTALTIAAPHHQMAAAPEMTRFSPSGAVGLVGSLESYFLASYLRDFNRFVPLTSEDTVTKGLLEVLSPMVSFPDPIVRRPHQRQASLSVFWGVVALGARILGANRTMVDKYMDLMRAALKECFDSQDKEVVQAYLLLSTMECMNGDCTKARRYLHFAETMYQSTKAMTGEEDEALTLVIDVFSRRCGSVCGGGQETGETRARLAAVDATATAARAGLSRRRALDALQLMTSTGDYAQKLLEPGVPCPTVKENLGKLDNIWQAVARLVQDSTLDECVTSIVPFKIWGGVTKILRGICKDGARVAEGLEDIESGVQFALTRPGLITFPIWWHGMHAAAIFFVHFKRYDSFRRLRSTYNASTFPGTEMPPLELFDSQSICLKDHSRCARLGAFLERTKSWGIICPSDLPPPAAEEEMNYAVQAGGQEDGIDDLLLDFPEFDNADFEMDMARLAEMDADIVDLNTFDLAGALADPIAV